MESTWSGCERPVEQQRRTRRAREHLRSSARAARSRRSVCLSQSVSPPVVLRGCTNDATMRTLPLKNRSGLAFFNPTSCLVWLVREVSAREYLTIDFPAIRLVSGPAADPQSPETDALNAPRSTKCQHEIPARAGSRRFSRAFVGEGWLPMLHVTFVGEGWLRGGFWGWTVLSSMFVRLVPLAGEPLHPLHLPKGGWLVPAAGPGKNQA